MSKNTLEGIISRQFEFWWPRSHNREAVMESRIRWLKGWTLALMAALALLAFPGVTKAVTVTVTVTQDSGPNIKRELFRSDGWGEIAFTFPVPLSATGDGLFRMFAGGDLNNIEMDLIDVTEGPFLDRTLLGTFAFPISDTHFTACENPPHSNPAGCPVPETVPGGLYYDSSRGPPVGDVEGRRNVDLFSAGTPGLIVPQSLLVGGTDLTISLFPRDIIFDLYIDRLELSYPISERDDSMAPPLPPEIVPIPAAVWLFGSGLLGLIGIARRGKA